MSKDSWYKAWKEAYIDLHVAYLGVIRLRHHRNQALELVIQRDMQREDPFRMASPSGKDAVRKWLGLWQKHECDSLTKQVMAAAAEALQNHWNTWSTLMDLCPPDFRKFRIEVPQSDFVTSTAVSRGTLEQRAKVLAEAWKRNIKGELK